MTGKEFVKRYGEPQIKEIARDIAESVVIRTYVDGCSEDVRRETTASEKEAIKAIAESALFAYSARQNGIDAILDMAEFMMHRLVPEANAYDSIYIPLRKVTETGLWEKKGA